jgi:hypothetical protein
MSSEACARCRYFLQKRLREYLPKFVPFPPTQRLAVCGARETRPLNERHELA